MFPSGHFQAGKPAPSQHDRELIEELKARINRPKAPMKVKSVKTVKPSAGNQKLTKAQIANLYGRTFKGNAYAYGRTIFIK